MPRRILSDFPGIGIIPKDCKLKELGKYFMEKGIMNSYYRAPPKKNNALCNYIFVLILHCNTILIQSCAKIIIGGQYAI